MHQYAPLSQFDESDDELDAAARSRNQRRSINQTGDHPPTDNQPVIDRSHQSKSVLFDGSTNRSTNQTNQHDRPPIGVLLMSLSLALLGISTIILSLPWPHSIEQSLLKSAKSELSLYMLWCQITLSLRIFSWWRALSIPVGMFLVASGVYTANEFAHYRQQHRHPGGYLFPRYK